MGVTILGKAPLGSVAASPFPKPSPVGTEDGKHDPSASKSKYAKHLTSTPATSKGSVVKHESGKPPVEVDSFEGTVHGGIVTNGPPAMVTVGGGQTFNTGNYNSVKISVSLSVPCDKEDINATYEFASDWVSARMSEAAKSVGAT